MDKITEIKKRIEKLIIEQGMSLNDVSIKLGLNPTYLFYFVKKKSPMRLKEDIRKKLAAILGVDEQYLTDIPLTEPLAEAKKNNSPIPEYDLINVLDVRAAAGNGYINGDNPEIITQKPFARKELRKITDTNPQHLSIIMVAGDSMEPTLHDNDQVLVDLTQKEVFNDGIYAFDYQGAMLVKRITIDPIKKRLLIKSDNPLYDIIEAKPDEVHVSGRIIWIAKRV